VAYILGIPVDIDFVPNQTDLPVFLVSSIQVYPGFQNMRLRFAIKEITHAPRGNVFSRRSAPIDYDVERLKMGSHANRENPIRNPFILIHARRACRGE
jgi:hypothetical protein